jgi:hypothetical protein
VEDSLLITRHLIVPLTVALFVIQVAEVKAQGTFPAPLPGASFPANGSAFPPVNGAVTVAVIGAPSAFPSAGAAPVTGSAFERPVPSQGGPSDECMSGFVPLRKEAERRGKMIQAAGERHAPPDEACKLIANFGQAEIKMIKYVESHAAKCGIPAQISDQLKQGHKNTQSMKTKVCAVAQEMQQRQPTGPSLSEVLGSSSAAIPEATPIKHNGGSIFDTLAGNVLERTVPGQ